MYKLVSSLVFLLCGSWVYADLNTLLSRVNNMTLKTPPGVDPEADMKFCEIADYHGYQCQEYLHQIVTDDGFLLTLHRVNGKKGEVFNTSSSREPVFVQHGLLCDSTSWILNLPDQNLPFLLSDAGYDVWVGNSRGNTYSRAHKTLSEDSDEFWAWSWDEMARYDLPASIDFVLKNTGYKNIQYIGHSQGTLIAFVHLITSPNNTKISNVLAMGPVFHVSNLVSPIKYLSPISTDVALVLKLLGIRDFLPNGWVFRLLSDYICDKFDPIHSLCGDVLFLIAGYDVKQLNQTRVPVYISHTPAGTSVRDVLHFAQMYESKTCSRFNYGSDSENIKHYGTKDPPEYHMESIKTPVSLFWAQYDWLADPQDVKYIQGHLKTIEDNNYIPGWNHLDFIWAVDAKKVVYDPIIQSLKRNSNRK